MAATLTDPPASPALNGNDNWITVSSDLQTSAVGYVDIIFTSSGPSVSETLTLSWSGKIILFTVAAFTNSTATAIPTKGAETLDEYAARVGAAFRENYLISQDWLVTVHTGGRVRITSKTVGVLTLTCVETMTGTAVTVTEGTYNTVTNLAAEVEIWKAGADFNTDALITTVHATYDANTADTKINLSEIFPVKPSLPNPLHIRGPLVFFTWLKGIATDCFLKYYFRIADKYGTPAVPEALLQSDNYHVLHGAYSADREPQSGFSFQLDKLHNYRRADGGVFYKPLADGMPDWLYIWVKVPLTACNVEWTVLWDDGTETVEPYGGTDFTLAENTAHYLRSTPLSFGFTPPSAGLIPWYITFRLKGDAGSGEQTLAEVKYRVKIDVDWQRYLLFDNGLGGCESVLFYGKPKDSYTSSRETARRVRTPDFSVSEGEYIQFNAEGQKEFELNTGWIEPFYVDHLRQLLLGYVWEIDYDNKRFLKLICDTESIQTNEGDQQLFSLSIKFKPAWMDKASNV